MRTYADLLTLYESAEEAELCQWMICRMNVFRLWFNKQLATHKGTVPGVGKNNRDGSSDFRAFRTADLPSGFVVAHRKGLLCE